MPQVCEAPIAPVSSRAKRPTPFGYQLLLDLYQCKRGACDDLTLCYEFLEQIVQVLQVEAQSPPFLFRTDGKRFPDKAGLSGWVPLVESGVQIHTLASKGFISIDIYSCQRFDLGPLKAFVRGYFSPHRMDEQFLERGLNYHQ